MDKQPAMTSEPLVEPTEKKPTHKWLYVVIIALVVATGSYLFIRNNQKRMADVQPVNTPASTKTAASCPAPSAEPKTMQIVTSKMTDTPIKITVNLIDQAIISQEELPETFLGSDDGPTDSGYAQIDCNGDIYLLYNQYDGGGDGPLTTPTYSSFSKAGSGEIVRLDGIIVDDWLISDDGNYIYYYRPVNNDGSNGGDNIYKIVRLDTHTKETIDVGPITTAGVFLSMDTTGNRIKVVPSAVINMKSSSLTVYYIDTESNKITQTKGDANKIPAATERYILSHEQGEDKYKITDSKTQKTFELPAPVGPVHDYRTF